MNFYLKNPSTQKTEGPLSLQEINARLSRKMLSHDYLATADLGETLKELENSRESDWLPLSEIPGIEGIPQKTQVREKLSTARQLLRLIGFVLMSAAFFGLWWLLIRFVDFMASIPS